MLTVFTGVTNQQPLSKCIKKTILSILLYTSAPVSDLLSYVSSLGQSVGLRSAFEMIFLCKQKLRNVRVSRL